MIVVADVRGSMSAMYLSELPAARRLSDGKAFREKMEAEVVLVSTTVEVVRSQVLRVWSHDEEYPTVESLGANIAAETQSECAFLAESGPRWGIES